MGPEKKDSGWNRIPIRFLGSEPESEISGSPESENLVAAGAEGNVDDAQAELTSKDITTEETEEPIGAADTETNEFLLPSLVAAGSGEAGGPLVAELVATRAELKRVEAEVLELKDRFARRQADFENYRKRLERERAETYVRAVAEIAAKLLPVLDNLRRALETEATVESSETDEFRHFLSGVDLIFKQLSGVLEALGVKPVVAVGARFDPHIHEAIVSEPSDEYEPDTVTQEIIRGYRLGDKLIRPALVKVAVKK